MRYSIERERRILRRLLRVVFLPSQVIDRWRSFRHPITSLTGVPVFAGSECGPHPPLISKLTDALQLLATTTPRHLRRLQTYGTRLLIDAELGYTYYWRSANAIVFEPTGLLSESKVTIASSLVHEIVHARVHRLGVPHSEARLPRIERRCTLASIDFLEQLPQEYVPEATRLVVWLQECLAAETPWWSSSYRRARRRKELAALDAPAWLIRALAPESRADRKNGV